MWQGRASCSGLTQLVKSWESLVCLQLCSGSPVGRWWKPCSYRLAAQWQRSCLLLFQTKIRRSISSLHTNPIIVQRNFNALPTPAILSWPAYFVLFIKPMLWNAPNVLNCTATSAFVPFVRLSLIIILLRVFKVGLTFLTKRILGKSIDQWILMFYNVRSNSNNLHVWHNNVELILVSFAPYLHNNNPAFLTFSGLVL